MENCFVALYAPRQRNFPDFATAVAINTVGYITINFIIILHQKYWSNKKAPK